MATSGYLIPSVREALRRGDCAGARMLIGDAQHGRLTPRQQTTVRRLLQTVERCDARLGHVRGRRQLRGQGAYDPPPFDSVEDWNAYNRRVARTARDLEAKAAQAERDGARDSAAHMAHENAALRHRIQQINVTYDADVRRAAKRIRKSA